MKRVRRSHTAPELAVRSVLRQLGLAYRTCVRGMPGSPDIANRRAGWVVFVHGCFWHGHRGCKLFSVPKSNGSFWVKKVEANRARDRRKIRDLRALGYQVITVWQCETRNQEKLRRRLARLLEVRSAA